MSLAILVLIAVQSSLATEPPIRTKIKGAMAISITPSSGTSQKTTLISAPLLNVDPDIPSTGRISRILSPTAVEILHLAPESVALPPDGYLARRTHPFALLMTSGKSTGSMYLVTENKLLTGQFTLLNLKDPNNPNMDLGVEGVDEGDNCQLVVVDTISSLLGTPSSTGVLGGNNPREADNLVIVANGSASTHYYSKQRGEWVRVGLGSPSSGHTPILPYYGVQYMRRSSDPLKIQVYGEIPYVARKMKVKPSGITLVASYWPKPISLRSAGFHQIEGWRSSTSPTADRVMIVTAGQASTYTHDGSAWRKIGIGQPLGDDTSIPAGSAVMLSRFSSSKDPVPFSQPMPVNDWSW
jgi:hypothetical protein